MLTYEFNSDKMYRKPVVTPLECSPGTKVQNITDCLPSTQVAGFTCSPSGSDFVEEEVYQQIGCEVFYRLLLTAFYELDISIWWCRVL